MAVYTSNVDGHFRRFATLSQHLTEIHGCAEEWACGSSMGFSRDADAPGSCSNLALPLSRGGAFAKHNVAVTAGAPSAQPTPWRAECESVRLLPSHAEMATLEQVSLSALTNPEAAASQPQLQRPQPLQRRPPQQQQEGQQPPPSGVGAFSSLRAQIDWSLLPPVCPECGVALRPAVLMFGDTDQVLLARLAAAAAEYQVRCEPHCCVALGCRV